MCQCCFFAIADILIGSIAAAIQASVGSVAADSAFAVLTSAAMGGFGAGIVFGLAWGIPAAILGGIAIWMRQQGCSDDGDDDGNDDGYDDGEIKRE